MRDFIYIYIYIYIYLYIYLFASIVETFLPGRMKFEFDLDPWFGAEIPTILRQSKEDCPDEEVLFCFVSSLFSLIWGEQSIFVYQSTISGAVPAPLITKVIFDCLLYTQNQLYR